MKGFILNNDFKAVGSSKQEKLCSLHVFPEIKLKVEFSRAIANRQGGVQQRVRVLGRFPVRHTGGEGRGRRRECDRPGHNRQVLPKIFKLVSGFVENFSALNVYGVF